MANGDTPYTWADHDRWVREVWEPRQIDSDHRHVENQRVLRELNAELTKLKDSTIAVAQSQQRIELTMRADAETRRQETLDDEKKRNLRIAIFAVVVALLVPLETAGLHFLGWS